MSGESPVRHTPGPNSPLPQQSHANDSDIENEYMGSDNAHARAFDVCRLAATRRARRR